MKVCVIGAGAAGLCALRHLAGDSNFQVVAYEQTDDIGGTWVYVEDIGLDKNNLPIHSSMYQNLRTNLPGKLMNFPDFMKMEVEEPCCVTHGEVLRYLNDYADHYQLRQFIQFERKVENVRPSPSESEGQEKWIVRVKNLKTNEVETNVFEAVMVCNGHYFDPYIPAISGIDSFPGTILHSHAYRKPEGFSGKRVLILGAASSGIDISLDLINHAAQIYLSHNNNRSICEPSLKLPASILQVAGVERIEEGRFILKDETSILVDVFIYCTGYRYSFPFLDRTCDISVDDNYVTPLYKHLINIKHPSMCLVGIPAIVLPFPMFHMQVQYFLRFLKGAVTLPSEIEMLEDSRLTNAKKRHAHKLANKQWEYNDSLASAGGFERLPRFYKIGFEIWSTLRTGNLLRYKDSKFIVSEDGTSVQVITPD